MGFNPHIKQGSVYAIIRILLRYPVIEFLINRAGLTLTNNLEMFSRYEKKTS